MNEMRTLVLLTDNFPYHSVTEEVFVKPEIQALSRYFDKVIIAPLLKHGNQISSFDLPDNVEITLASVINLSLRNKILALAKKFTYIVKSFYPSKKYIHELAYTAYVGLAEKGILNLIAKHQLDLKSTLFYSFWFGFQTAALASIPDTKFITRAHGHDIFESGTSYISRCWRRKSLSNMIACFPACCYSEQYLKRQYPAYAEKISHRYLGSTPPQRNNPPGREGNPITFYGCARLSPEKGVQQQMQLLNAYAAANPQKDFLYIHVGDGILQNEIKTIASEAPGNLRYRLMGEISNNKVQEILENEHIDVAFLLSKSEGGCPIAICECISRNIPVIGTRTGGITELLESGAGRLLNPDPNLSEFSATLDDMLFKRHDDGMTPASYWKSTFNAYPLRESFAKEISHLID